jgi:hypothetical protein
MPPGGVGYCAVIAMPIHSSRSYLPQLTVVMTLMTDTALYRAGSSPAFKSDLQCHAQDMAYLRTRLPASCTPADVVLTAVVASAARCCVVPTQMRTTRPPAARLMSGSDAGAHTALNGCGETTSCPAGDPRFCLVAAEPQLGFQDPPTAVPYTVLTHDDLTAPIIVLILLI